MFENEKGEQVLENLANKRMIQIIDTILQNVTMNSLDLRRKVFVKLYATSPSVIKFLENSIDETNYTIKIEALNIPSDFNIVTFRLNKYNIEK